MKELGPPVQDETSRVAGVAALVRDGHAHVDDGQGVHVPGREAENVLDHQEAVVVRSLLCWARCLRQRFLGARKGTAHGHQGQRHQQGMVGDDLGEARGLLHDRRAAERLLALEAPQRARAQSQEGAAARAAAPGASAQQGRHAVGGCCANGKLNRQTAAAQGQLKRDLATARLHQARSLVRWA